MAAPVCFVEFIEDIFDLFLGHADTRIGYGDNGISIVFLSAYGDCSFVVGVYFPFD